MDTLIFIFCILYFILVLRRLDWAVMFLIAALPVYLIRFNILGVPLTLLETMILISFGAWFITNFNKLKTNLTNLFKRDKNKIKIDYPFKHEIILMLIISFIAAGVSGFSDEALGIWKAYFFEPALLFILVINIFKEKDGINKILWPLAISAFAVSVFAIYQKFTGAFIVNEFWAAEETRRVVSFFGYPNAVGLYLGPVILILIGWLIQQAAAAKERIISYKLLVIFIIIVISLLSIYFAKSEGALIGIIAGLFVFGIFANKKIRWITVGLAVLAVMGIMVFVPAREYAVNKILLRDLSGQIRKAQWAETWEMLNDGKLIFGAGLANYQNAIKPYHKAGIFVRDYNDPNWHRKTVWNEEFRNSVWQPTEIYLYPHNIFLNFWVELGLAGMLLFAWIIVKYFIIGFKIIRHSTFDIRHLTIGLLSALVVVIIHGLVDVPYFKNDLAPMFWIFLAMMGILNIQHNQINNQS
jgi:O-antigen ligase